MKKQLLIFALLAVPLAAWCQAPPAGKTAAEKTPAPSPFADYAGDWVATFEGKAWLLLEIELKGDQVSGWLTHARDLEMNDEGGLRSVSDDKVKEVITEATVNPDGLLITVKYAEAKETDQYVMRVTEPGKTAELKMVAMEMPPGMPKPKPWTLLKFPGGVEVEPK